MVRSVIAFLVGGMLFVSMPEGGSEASPPTAPVLELRGSAFGDPSWRHDSIWDDGLAEFAAYRVRWPRYGRTYEGRALLVVVKEPWAPDLDVKADTARDDGFDVLKLNHIRDVQTGIYAYHQMASSFIRRDDGRLRKLSASSQEACGLSTAHLTARGLDAWSYFDGQGHRTIAWPKGALPHDGLTLMLRDYVRGELPKSLAILPSLLNGRQPKIEATSLRLARKEQKIEVAAGNFDAVVLMLGEGEESWHFVFDAEAPHTLLLCEGPGGFRYELVKKERLAYWQMKAPEHARWWP